MHRQCIMTIVILTITVLCGNTFGTHRITVNVLIRRVVFVYKYIVSKCFLSQFLVLFGIILRV